jgi:hypothetical protein
MHVAGVVIGLCFSVGVVSAAVMDCSGSKMLKERPYTEVIKPGDRVDHEMRQAIRIHVVTSSDADFDGAEQMAHAHEDVLGNAGTSVGYFKYTLRNGEQLWAKFESVFSTVRGDTWRTTYQGVFTFTSGTGKYQGIRGGGHYEGSITAADGFREKSTCRAEY